MALAAKYERMATALDLLMSDDNWKIMRVTHEHAIKLADCIQRGFITSLTPWGKRCLSEAFNAAVKDGFITPNMLERAKK